MKKLFSLIAAGIVLLYASCALATVGIRVNGQVYGQATDLNFICGSGVNSQPTADGSIFNVTCKSTLATAGLANGGSTSIASTVTAVPVSFGYVRKVLDSDGNATFTAGTLANGIPGQVLTIYAAGITPSGAVTGGSFTITPSTSTGFASVKLTAVNDVVTLTYIDDSFGWVISNWTPGASNSITINLKN